MYVRALYLPRCRSRNAFYWRACVPLPCLQCVMRARDSTLLASLWFYVIISDYSAPQMRKSSIVISAFIHTPSPASVPLSASPPGPGKGATASERGDGKVSHGVVGNGDGRGRSTPIRLFYPCCSRQAGRPARAQCLPPPLLAFHHECLKRDRRRTEDGGKELERGREARQEQ